MDALIGTIVIATLPAFILLYYFWRRDKGEKEPMKLMRSVFFAGILVIFPAAIVEGILEYGAFAISIDTSLIYLCTMPFLVVALPEELSKFWVVKRKVYDNPKFNEIMDGITYSIIASMGFAVFENIIYTFSYGTSTGILRAFTAVPAHALFSGIMGYYIGLAKFTKDKKATRQLFIKGLAAGVFFHGFYDFLALSGIWQLVLLIFPLLGYMAFILNRAINQANTGKPQPLRYF